MPVDVSYDCDASLYSIVLAAGASTRYGSPKQLAPVAGRTMLRTTIECAARVTEERVIVVLGAHAVAVRATLGDFRGIVVFNQRWSEGIASSIRIGVAHLPVTCAAVLVLLSDQPAVTSEDLKTLISVWQGKPQSMAAALYGDVVGAPAIFPRRSFGELAEIRGDIGARQLLHREANRLLRVQMPNAAIDVDRPEDLARFGHAK